MFHLLWSIQQDLRYIGRYNQFMPELPEVETIARGLASRLTGRRIAWVHLSRADMVHGDPMPLCAGLHGKRIERVFRRGKQVGVDIGAGQLLVFHLGMSGRLIVTTANAKVKPHTHLRMWFSRCRLELRFIDPRRFGGIWLTTGRAGLEWFGRRLPPVAADPLTISLKDFRRTLDRQRQIKALLLDQRPISGVGNIYCDESLHRAGIHPRTKAADLDGEEVKRLWQSLRRVLNEAVRAGGSSISDYRTSDNEPGMFQVRHRVYGREGRPCKKCGAVVVHLMVAGRSTFICPRCQPE